MNWLDRYIEAVKRYLPKTLREDIGEELESLLREKIEEATDTKGSPLQEAETLSLLKGFGHPLEVASGYQGRRVLISEALFPIYKRALRYLVIGLLALFVATSVLSSSGVLPADFDIDFISIGLLYTVLLTASFHFLDEYLRRIDFFARWNPVKLPVIHEGVAPVAMGESIASIICLLLWFWLLAAISDDYSWATLIGRSGSRAATIMLWMKAHAVLSLALSLANLYRPYWTRSKLTVESATSVLFALIAASMLMTPQIGRLIIGDAYGEIQPLTWMTDLNLRLILGSLVAVGIVATVSSLRKLAKLS